MTAPDPRLGEIEARHRVIRRCLEAHPNDSYDMSDLDWAVEEAKDDIPYLLAELRTAREALARVEGLHRPIQKWEPYEGAGYTFATREEALRAGGEEDLNSVAMEAGPQSFEVCRECSRVEGEQLAEIGEEWGYRESLWPCPTSAAVAAADGGGQQLCRRKCDCVNAPEGSPDCRYCDYKEPE